MFSHLKYSSTPFNLRNDVELTVIKRPDVKPCHSKCSYQEGNEGSLKSLECYPRAKGGSEETLI